jgi:hypothetical protein
VCTITSPATGVAGPVSRGARLFSIHASAGLLIFEDADRRHRVIWCIDHVVGFEARDITDDRDRLLLDRESQRLRYQRGDMLVKGGWLTLPGSAEPVVGAANICAQKLTSEDLKTAING